MSEIFHYSRVFIILSQSVYLSTCNFFSNYTCTYSVSIFRCFFSNKRYSFSQCDPHHVYTPITALSLCHSLVSVTYHHQWSTDLVNGIITTTIGTRHWIIHYNHVETLQRGNSTLVHKILVAAFNMWQQFVLS